MVDGECVCLASRPVEREHELRTKPLAQRVPRNQQLELADKISMPAGGEISLESILERRGVQLLEPGDLPLGEAFVSDVSERRPPPQGERLAETRRGLVRPTFGERSPSLLAEPLVTDEVELFRLEA